MSVGPPVLHLKGIQSLGAVVTTLIEIVPACWGRPSGLPSLSPYNTEVTWTIPKGRAMHTGPGVSKSGPFGARQKRLQLWVHLPSQHESSHECGGWSHQCVPHSSAGIVGQLSPIVPGMEGPAPEKPYHFFNFILRKNKHAHQEERSFHEDSAAQVAYWCPPRMPGKVALGSGLTACAAASSRASEASWTCSL